MRIYNINKVEPGDLVLYKGTGKIFGILSFLYGLFSRRWRKVQWKPWHVSVVIGFEDEMPKVVEGTTPESRTNVLGLHDLLNVRFYRLDNFVVSQKGIDHFVAENVGKKYDVAVYFWTTLWYMLRRQGIRIPRILNDRYTCWELAAKFYAHFHHPICRRSQYPMMIDFLEEVGEVPCPRKR